MNILKKLTSGFLALILLSGLMPAMAEEDEEELSFEDMIPEVEEGAFEDEADWTITDEVQETIEDLDSWEIDTSVNPDDLELNTELPENVVNILVAKIREVERSDFFEHIQLIGI